MAAAVLAAGLLLTACGADGNDDLAQRASNDGTNYIAGDGSVQEIAAENRGEAVTFESETFEGETVTAETFQGEVSVINFWYAACAPCRKEAPDLQAIYEEFEADSVQFYGVNTRDTQPTAEAFERTFGITYPSMEDRGGSVLMSMTSYVHPSAVPTTLVLDRQGRVSARISGLVDPGTLRALISTALEEDQAQAEAAVSEEAAATLPTL
ncbi:TlpA family protein disulfide reductase [Nesterenkonia sphaerica]|uniref:TlpA family protein disulfide reductase n=2 Tax=Nesterenkonia sphaerica TaxID=1804988 RepID=A0A5R9A4E0_9MICC|nr:TlpA family protein disulfide reductase [Nesterenkonia sphaerica]